MVKKKILRDTEKKRTKEENEKQKRGNFTPLHPSPLRKERVWKIFHHQNI